MFKTEALPDFPQTMRPQGKKAQEASVASACFYPVCIPGRSFRLFKLPLSLTADNFTVLSFIETFIFCFTAAPAAFIPALFKPWYKKYGQTLFFFLIGVFYSLLLFKSFHFWYCCRRLSYFYIFIFIKRKDIEK